MLFNVSVSFLCTFQCFDFLSLCFSVCSLPFSTVCFLMSSPLLLSVYAYYLANFSLFGWILVLELYVMGRPFFWKQPTCMLWTCLWTCQQIFLSGMLQRCHWAPQQIFLTGMLQKCPWTSKYALLACMLKRFSGLCKYIFLICILQRCPWSLTCKWIFWTGVLQRCPRTSKRRTTLGPLWWMCRYGHGKSCW